MKRLTLIYAYLVLALGLTMAAAPFHWMPDVLVSYVPLFLILAIVAIVLCLLQWHFWLVLMLGALVLYFGGPSLYWWYVPDSSKPAITATSRSLSIMQLNVHNKNTKYTAVTDLIRRVQPDVIILEEVTTLWMDAVRLEVGDLYPYRVESPTDDWRGMALLSKKPLTNEHAYESAGDAETPFLLFATLSDYDIDVYGLHALSPSSSQWSAKRDLFLQDTVQEALSDRSRSVIIAGDFNMTVHAPLYSKLIRMGLRNAEQGKGWSPTWMSGSLLAAAIDHVLYSGILSAVSSSVLQDVGSDHRPVFVRFAVTGS